MKKSLVWGIIFLVALAVVIISFIFHLIYFNDFHKSLRPISEMDKQKAIGLLSKSVDLEGYQVKVGNIYVSKNTDFVQIELIKNYSKKYYLVDLKEGKIIKR